MTKHKTGTREEWLAAPLRRDGSSQTDLQRERAHQLLSQLASEPIRSAKAIEVLHLLQNE